MAIMRAEMRLIVGDSVDDMIGELAPLFISDIPPLIDEAERMLAAHDANRLKEVAHTLKGSSSSMGLRRFSELCFELEMLARENDLAEAPTKIDQIRIEYMAISHALEGFT